MFLPCLTDGTRTDTGGTDPETDGERTEITVIGIDEGRAEITVTICDISGTSAFLARKFKTVKTGLRRKSWGDPKTHKNAYKRIKPGFIDQSSGLDKCQKRKYEALIQVSFFTGFQV